MQLACLASMVIKVRIEHLALTPNSTALPLFYCH